MEAWDAAKAAWKGINFASNIDFLLNISGAKVSTLMASVLAFLAGLNWWGALIIGVGAWFLVSALEKRRGLIPSKNKGLEFFTSREGLSKRYTVQDQLRAAGTIWALWNTGTRAYVEGAATAGTLKRLLLPDPSQSFPAFAVADGTSEPGIKSNIRDITDEASKRGIDVRWFRGYPGNTMMIGDPRSGDGWLHVELFQARVPAHLRPSFRVRRKHDAVLYDAYVGAFEKLWDAGTPREADPVLFTDKKNGRPWRLSEIQELSDSDRHGLWAENPTGFTAWENELARRQRSVP